jgi:hypothetical protein
LLFAVVVAVVAAAADVVDVVDVVGAIRCSLYLCAAHCRQASVRPHLVAAVPLESRLHSRERHQHRGHTV